MSSVWINDIGDNVDTVDFNGYITDNNEFIFPGCFARWSSDRSHNIYIYIFIPPHGNHLIVYVHNIYYFG